MPNPIVPIQGKNTYKMKCDPKRDTTVLAEQVNH